MSKSMMDITKPVFTKLQLAQLLDDCCDADGWDGGDVCEALAQLCENALKRCPCGAVSAASAVNCSMCGDPMPWGPPSLKDDWRSTPYIVPCLYDSRGYFLRSIDPTRESK